MTRNEAANAKPIDQSMQEDPLEKKYPLESLKGTPHAQANPELLSDDEFFTDETFSECLHKAAAQLKAETETEAFIEKTSSARFHEAKSNPPVTPLFDAFWLKGELAFLFGETGVGKSILAVQILDAISKGAKVKGFEGSQKPMRVGYFDFELGARHLLERYSDEGGNRYKFSPNFFRFEINSLAGIPKGVSVQDYLLEQIEKKIIKHRIEVAVIDSLTSVPLIGTKTNEQGLMRMEFMHRLYLMKSRQNISVLVVAHSLRKDSNRPITEYDIVDSSIFGTVFCDSVFAIGKSVTGNHLRYLKQIKCSSAELKYGSRNVAVFELVKRNRFIGFKHIGFNDERKYLCNFL
jgi:archaellum biogenesis ATPase FlaH